MSDDLVKRLRDDSGDWLTDLAADRIEELEAKLAKAVEALEFWQKAQEPDIDEAIELMQTTLAELKGDPDA